jgi:hypothetical protein
MDTEKIGIAKSWAFLINSAGKNDRKNTFYHGASMYLILFDT